MGTIQQVGVAATVQGVKEFVRGMDAMSRSVNRFESDVATTSGRLIGIGSSISNIGNALSRTGGVLTAGISAPIALVGKTAIQAAIEYETAFAGVAKTTDGVVRQVNESLGNLSFSDRLTEFGRALEEDFRNLSLEIPVDAVELAGIAEVGGQLGIIQPELIQQNADLARGILVDFVDTVARIAVSTDATAEEAATAMGRIISVFQIPGEQVAVTAQQIGNAVVALGNNLATTEAPVLRFSELVAGSASAVGIAIPDVLALGAAAIATGSRVEASSTAIQKTLFRIDSIFKAASSGVIDNTSAIAAAEDELAAATQELADTQNQVDNGTFVGTTREGKQAVKEATEQVKSLQEEIDNLRASDGMTEINDQVDVIAKITGYARDEIVDFYKNADPAQKGEFIQAFFEGLGDNAETLIADLEVLELTDQRLIGLFARFAGAQEVVARAFELAREQAALSADELDTIGALAIESSIRFSTTESQLKLLSNAFTNLGIVIGSAILPILSSIVSDIAPVIIGITKSFSSLDKGTQKTIFIFVALAAALGPALLLLGGFVSVIGTVVTGLGGLAAAFAFLLTPIGLVLSGLTAIGAYLASRSINFGGIRDSISQFISDISNTDDFGQGVQKAFEGLFSNIKFGDVGSIRSLFSNVFDGAQKIFKSFGQTVRQTIAEISANMPNLGDTIVTTVTRISTSFSRLISFMSTELAGAAPTLGKILGGAIVGLANIADKLLPLIATGVEKAVNYIITHFGQFKANVISAFDVFKTRVLPALTYFYTVAVAVVGRLRNFFSTAFEQIRTTLASLNINTGNVGFGPIVLAIGALVTAAIKLSPAIGSFIGAFAKLSPVLATVSGKFSFISPLISTIVSGFGRVPGVVSGAGSALGRLLGPLSSLGSALITVGARIFYVFSHSKIGTIIGRFGIVLTRTLFTYIDKAIGLVQLLATPLFSALGAIGRFLSLLGTGIAGFFVRIATYFAPFLALIGRFGAGIYNLLIAPLVSIFNFFAGRLLNVFSILKIIFQPLTSLISSWGLFGKVLGALGGPLGYIRAGLALVGGVLTSYPVLIAIVVGSILSLIATLSGINFGELLANILSGNFSEAFGQLKQGFANIVEGVKQLFADIATVVQSTFGDSLGEAWISLQLAWARVLELGEPLKGLFSALGGLFQTIAPIVGGILVGAFGILLAAIRGVIQGVSAALPYVVTVIQGVIQVVTGIIQVITGIVQAIVEAVTAIITGETPNFLAAWENIKAGTINIVIGLVDAIINAFSAVVIFLAQTLDGFFGGIGGFIAGIGDTIGIDLGGIETAMSGWGTSTTTIMEGIANDWKVALGIADVGGQSAQQFDEAQNATETFSEAQARAAQDTSKSWLDSFLDLDFGGAVSTSFDTATTAVDEFNTDSNTSIAETVAGWQSTILNGLPSDTFTLPFSTATTEVSNWSAETTAAVNEAFGGISETAAAQDPFAALLASFNEAQNATETFSEAQARAAQDTSKSWLDSFLDLDFGGAVSTSFDTATTAVDEFNTDSNTSIAETVAGWQSTILNGLPSDTFTLPFSTATTEVSNWSAETTAAVNEAFGGISETAAEVDPFAALLESFNNNQIAVDEWGISTQASVGTTLDTLYADAQGVEAGFVTPISTAFTDATGYTESWATASTPLVTEAISAMTSAAATGMPQFSGAIEDGMTSATNAIAQTAPVAVNATNAVVNGAVSAARAHIPEFVGVGQDIGGGIATGIASSLDGIKAQIEDVISQAKAAAAAAAEIKSPSRLFDREIGQPIGYGVAQGVERAGPAVSSATVGLVSNALNKASGVDTTTVGRSIGDGIRDGIEESAPHVRRVLIGLTTGIVAGAEEILEANSPSRVFHRLGVGVGQGLANGIRESSDNVFDALDGIIGEASRFGRLANDFASELAEKLAAPFESQISGVEDTIKTLEDELGAVEDVTQSRLDLYDQFLARATSTDDVNRLLSERANFLSEQSRHQDELTASLTAEQARLAQINAEIERSGEALARVEASQSQLDFIQQQQELLDLIRSSGFAFDGLPEILGINGDLASLTELAASAFEELVRQSNDALLLSAFTLPPIFDPAEIDSLLSGLTGLTRDFAEIELTNITDQLNTIDEQIAQERFNLFTGQTDDAEASQRRIAELEAERLGLAEEYRAEQERILELQEKQQKLDFLEKQLNLLDLIDQNGLDKDAILQGLVFGADASLDDLLEAMSRITDALIGQAEDDLEIASPSKVFTRLGKNIPLGLANGITDGLGAIPGLVGQAVLSGASSTPISPYAVQPQYSSSVTNIDRSTSVQVDAQYSRAQDPQGIALDLQAIFGGHVSW